MILRKLIILFTSIFILFSASYTLSYAESTECNHSGCISSSNFKIDVGKITPTTTGQSSDSIVGADSEETINNLFGKIITMLITAFGVLSLLVMTIGAGFMIIYHGQDELLTRGKSIFSYGLISLVVALSAGFLVNFVSYLLYGW